MLPSSKPNQEAAHVLFCSASISYPIIHNRLIGSVWLAIATFLLHRRRPPFSSAELHSFSPSCHFAPRCPSLLPPVPTLHLVPLLGDCALTVSVACVHVTHAVSIVRRLAAYSPSCPVPHRYFRAIRPPFLVMSESDAVAADAHDNGAPSSSSSTGAVTRGPLTVEYCPSQPHRLPLFATESHSSPMSLTAAAVSVLCLSLLLSLPPTRCAMYRLYYATRVLRVQRLLR